MQNQPIELKISPDDNEVAYLYLPKHPRLSDTKIVERQLELSNLIENYSGPSIYLDFDNNGVLIGLEVLA